MSNLIPIERIENKIYIIREEKVMLDFDLAKLYGVKTKNLNKAVKRNKKRFPPDFMFRLNKEEYDALRFQNGTSKKGGRRYLPYAFSEHGVAMLSSVLKSDRAVQVNIFVIRTFIKLRKVLSTHKELAQKITELEGKVGKHDQEIEAVFDVIRRLMKEEEKPKKRIGFLADRENN